MQGNIVKWLYRSAFTLPFNVLLVLVLLQFSDKVPVGGYMVKKMIEQQERKVWDNKGEIERLKYEEQKADIL